jgi:DNA-binding NtrC family response regulator
LGLSGSFGLEPNKQTKQTEQTKQTKSTEFIMEKKDFKILVADDDDIVRDVITTLLSGEGYSVTPAVDGLEAIARLGTQDVHLVITDLKMPGADGLEVLKRSVQCCPGVAVVMLTAYGTLDATLAAMNEGAYDYLAKPFNAQEITTLAGRAFERARIMAANRDLRTSLRDTYLDTGLFKCLAQSANPEAAAAWVERIEGLKSMKVLTANEAEMLSGLFD